MRVLKNWFIILCLLPLASFAEVLITEESIEVLVSKIEQAAKKQDAEQLLAHFTKDAKITFEFSESQGGKMEFGVVGYEELLKQGWSMPMGFSYQVNDIVISVAEDGKSAVVTDVVTETVTMDGEVIMTTRTHEKIDIANVDGLPLITKVYGLVSIDAELEPAI